MSLNKPISFRYQGIPTKMSVHKTLYNYLLSKNNYCTATVNTLFANEARIIKCADPRNLSVEVQNRILFSLLPTQYHHDVHRTGYYDIRYKNTQAGRWTKAKTFSALIPAIDAVSFNKGEELHKRLAARLAINSDGREISGKLRDIMLMRFFEWLDDYC